MNEKTDPSGQQQSHRSLSNVLSSPNKKRQKQNLLTSSKKWMVVNIYKLVSEVSDTFYIEEDCYTTKTGKLRLKTTANLILTNTCDENLEDDLENYFQWKNGAKPRLKITATLKNLEGVSEIQENVDLDPDQASTSNIDVDVPICHSVPQDTQQNIPAQTPLRHDSDSDDDAPNQEERDPLSCRIEQCRFCGEFSKDCIAISNHMTYVDGYKTILSLNGMSVQLDFNGTQLKTVCKDCDVKLRELCVFMQQVKNAQDTLINVNEVKTTQDTLINVDEVKTTQKSSVDVKYSDLLVVKTESKSDVSDNENETIEVNNEDSSVRISRHPLNIETNDTINRVEDKIGESHLSVETANVTHKRKSDNLEATNKHKKVKAVTDRNQENVKDTVEVKEEPIDTDEINSDVDRLVTTDYYLLVTRSDI